MTKPRRPRGPTDELGLSPDSLDGGKICRLLLANLLFCADDPPNIVQASR
jgi:hypothetical protein